MSIDISLAPVHDCRGRVAAVHCEAMILFSPREGFDADKLAALERDLGEYVGARLNDALRKGVE